MTFKEVLAQVIDWLQQDKRVSYRALKLQFDLDDDYIEGLKDELIYAQQVARDEEDRILVWLGESATEPEPTQPPIQPTPVAPSTTEPGREPLSYTPSHLAEKILTTRSALEGERKQVTVLFCDLRNSTAIAEKIGAEAMHGLLSRFFELAMDEVHYYEGTVNQLLGDGFMALFGAPIAHEDHARRAVLAALDLQRTLRDHHEELGGQHGVELSFRMGLNTGMVVVGSVGNDLRLDYTAIGDTTNLAARLEQIAEPGTILASENTSRLVQGYVRLEALEPVEVKGKTEPVSVFKVIGTLPRRSPVVSRGERTLSTFVGRERELAVLDELLEQVEGGQGQIVGIVAEAGTGKSRLLYEFRQRLADRRVTYLEGRCLSYGSAIPYHPILDLLRHNCGIADTDGPEAIIEKVRFALQEVQMEMAETAPYLLQLLGVQEETDFIAVLTPEAVRTRTFETLREMSFKGSQQRPLIFEIEDLHWLDQTSEDYLASLVDNLAGVSILLLTTYRPGYRPPWLEKSYATQISLHSLAPDDALTVVHSTSQHEALPDHLAQTIIAKAEGNPFFLEELTRAVTEHTDFQADMTVPDTIQGVLSARLDRLPEACKRLLQTASVLGREFSPNLLEKIWEGAGALEPPLLELKRLEFLYERTGAEEPIYVFKHALTQEVAYESLLTTRRQALHAVAGQALEVLYANQLDDVVDRLAYHYTHTTDAAKAITYLKRFAERAARNHAHTEAATALQQALSHVERVPAAERDHHYLDILLRLVPSLHFVGRFPESLEVLLHHRERLARVQEPWLSGPYYFWLGHTYSYLGDQAQTIQYAHQALDYARRCDDQVTLGRAYYLLARDDGYWSGHFLRGIEHSRQAIAALEHTDELWWLGQSYWVLGLNCIFMGAFLSALEAETHTQHIGETLGDPRLQAYAAWTTGMLYGFMGECDQGILACQRSLERSPDVLTTAVALGFLGYNHLQQGEHVRAIPHLEESLRYMEQFRFRQLHGWYMAWLGEAYLRDGQIEKARDLASQSLTITRNAKFWSGVGDAQRTLGRVAQTSGDLTEAETHLQEALATFSSIHSQYELARTHLDLASLAHTQGDQDATTTHLSTAHAWFQKLQVPKWMGRTEQLAQEYGVTLTEVELEEFETEGAP